MARITCRVYIFASQRSGVKRPERVCPTHTHRGVRLRRLQKSRHTRSLTDTHHQQTQCAGEIFRASCSESWKADHDSSVRTRTEKYLSYRKYRCSLHVPCCLSRKLSIKSVALSQHHKPSRTAVERA